MCACGAVPVLLCLWCCVCVAVSVLVAEDAYELRSFTPSFMWLLRDFYLDLEEEDGHKVRLVVVVGGCGGEDRLID